MTTLSARAAYNRLNPNLAIGRDKKEPPVTYYRVFTLQGSLRTYDIQEAKRWKASGLKVTQVIVSAF